MPSGDDPPVDDRSGADAPIGAGVFVFVTDLDSPETTTDDAHHLAHVLRLRPGDLVAAGDGLGNWRACRYRGDASRRSRGGAALEPDGPIVSCRRPAPRVTVAFVPVKGDRPEWTVQKLTEAGVDRIAILSSSRAVVRWEGERQPKAIDRLRRVAREAAAQSRRPWLPDVNGVMALDDLARELSPTPVALAHPGGEPPTPRVPAVAVGPEGGWDPEETARGYPLVGLGPRILRAETAAVAAGLLLCALRDGVVAAAAGSQNR